MLHQRAFALWTPKMLCLFDRAYPTPLRSGGLRIAAEFYFSKTIFRFVLIKLLSQEASIFLNPIIDLIRCAQSPTSWSHVKSAGEDIFLLFA